MDNDNSNKKVTKDKLANFIKSEYSDNSLFARKMNEHFGGEGYLKSGLGIQNSGGMGRNNLTLAEQIKQAKDAKALRVISNKSKTNQGYADVINFYKTMFYYRYTVVPVRSDHTKEAVSPEELRDMSYNMLEIVESAGLEAILPNVIESGMFDGLVALYLEKKGNDISTYLLPVDYCEPFLSTNYGTTTIVFDLEYFDNLFNELNGSNDVQFGPAKKESAKAAEKTKQQQLAILSLFPKELTSAYKAFKGVDESMNKTSTSEEDKGSRYIQLDQKKAAIIPFSPSMAPPMLKALAAEERYESISEISALKDSAGLEKIFTHRLPLNEDGELAITIPEAESVQRSLQKLLSGDASIKVVTTLGETNLLEVQKGLDERSTVVNDAFDSQYLVSGINPEMFRANTDYALSVSLQRNSSFVWSILQKIMTFYNLSINQQFKFGDYSCSVTLLPINVYNEAAQISAYRSSAAYGIGKLEAIVATGEKQISLYDKLELEAMMELDTRLTPLQSSHTQSSKGTGVETDTGKGKEVEKVEREAKEKKVKKSEVQDV